MRESIRAVKHTLIEAVVLVVLVVILFLQTWRASIIPLIAVPVSIVGTFAWLYLLGYSGVVIPADIAVQRMVLAIGIVVDDAIVVVENVERNIQEGSKSVCCCPPGDDEKYPGLSLRLRWCSAQCSCPWPFLLRRHLVSFTGGLQSPIAISTVISAVNSLTLSPGCLLHSCFGATMRPKMYLARGHRTR